MKLCAALLPAIVLLLIVVASSCRRDYTCQCDISYSGAPGLPDTLTRKYPISDTKKNAQKLCEENSSDTEKDGIRTIEDCYLF